MKNKTDLFKSFIKENKDIIFNWSVIHYVFKISSTTFVYNMWNNLCFKANLRLMIIESHYTISSIYVKNSFKVEDLTLDNCSGFQLLKVLHSPIVVEPRNTTRHIERFYCSKKNPITDKRSFINDVTKFWKIFESPFHYSLLNDILRRTIDRIFVDH